MNRSVEMEPPPTIRQEDGKESKATIEINGADIQKIEMDGGQIEIQKRDGVKEGGEERNGNEMNRRGSENGNEMQRRGSENGNGFVAPVLTSYVQIVETIKATLKSGKLDLSDFSRAIQAIDKEDETKHIQEIKKEQISSVINSHWPILLHSLDTLTYIRVSCESGRDYRYDRTVLSGLWMFDICAKRLSFDFHFSFTGNGGADSCILDCRVLPTTKEVFKVESGFDISVIQKVTNPSLPKYNLFDVSGDEWRDMIPNIYADTDIYPLFNDHFVGQIGAELLKSFIFLTIPTEIEDILEGVYQLQSLPLFWPHNNKRKRGDTK